MKAVERTPCLSLRARLVNALKGETDYGTGSGPSNINSYMFNGLAESKINCLGYCVCPEFFMLGHRDS